MTKVQNILKEINELNANELELVYLELQKKIDETKRINSILDQYIGIGKGIWEIDAQDHISNERDQDRI